MFFGLIASPIPKPVINPHKWAEVLTCGVKKSNKTWITMMSKMLSKRCLACQI